MIDSKILDTLGIKADNFGCSILGWSKGCD